jgi:hypothetical protein
MAQSQALTGLLLPLAGWIRQRAGCSANSYGGSDLNFWDSLDHHSLRPHLISLPRRAEIPTLRQPRAGEQNPAARPAERWSFAGKMHPFAARARTLEAGPQRRSCRGLPPC